MKGSFLFRVKNLFLISVIFVFWQCVQDDQSLIPNTQQINFESHTTRVQEIINADNIPEIINFISKQKIHLLPNQEERNSENEEVQLFGEINLDQIVALVNDEQADDKTYTFGISTPEFFDQ